MPFPEVFTDIVFNIKELEEEPEMDTIEELLLEEQFIEKLPTGSLVIIPGEYVAVDENDVTVIPKPFFMMPGDHTPMEGKKNLTWKLVEAIDYSC